MDEKNSADVLEIVDEITLFSRASDLDIERIREFARYAGEHERPLMEILIERAGVREEDLLLNLSKSLRLPCQIVEDQNIPNEILESISPGLAINHHVIPLCEKDGVLHVACWNPFDWQKWDELVHMLGRPLQKVLCPRPIIERMLNKYYGIGADTVERLIAGRDDGKDIQVVGDDTTNLSEEEAANEPTVVNLVNKILAEAIRVNATDIHFEPYESKYRVRYRIDGMLEDVSIPVSVKLLKLALVSRIKIMSNLDITEKRLPQDGRSQVSLAGQEYDLRISILPRSHGESVVIRLQSRQMVKLDLNTLGFEVEESRKISEFIESPYGLVLITGPTGSGKTTTLYACLNQIFSPTTKIITVEDPVEYWMDDVVQLQVHDEIGFDFARALRGILRHDPDIILIGEIRDRETADIAIRASLTGHLVLASLHTNDAPSGVTRLIDIGIEPFLVASSVQGIIAQRLVRKVCPHCRIKRDFKTMNDIERRLLENVEALEDIELWDGQGCEKCRFTGFRGRVALGETLTISPQIKTLIQGREPAEHIKTAACKEGMRTLRQSGVLAIKRGLTSISEVLRVTQEDF